MLQAFQAAAVAGSSSNTSVVGKKSLNGARGLDERAKKKAAAKALLVSRHGSPAQASLPISNIINPGAPPPPEVAVNEATNGGKKESDESSNGVLGHEAKPGQQDQAPVGLGTGLAALDAKKRKSKSKGKAKAELSN